MARIATTSESGMASTEMLVARTSPRKRKRITTTRMAPSRRASITFATARRMKLDWRKSSVWRRMPSGSVRWIASSSPSMRSVSSKVLAPGCFCTESTTPDVAFTEPSPTFGAAPIATSATWPSSTGTPSWTVTTVCAISSTPRARPMPRITTSWPRSR